MEIGSRRRDLERLRQRLPARIEHAPEYRMVVVDLVRPRHEHQTGVIERSARLDGRLDGHMVQGHVDQTAVCTEVIEAGGSWYYTFEYEPLQDDYITVEKGSVSVNGVSLTVVNSKPRSFQVAIIPFTYEVTNFHQIRKGTVVNLEFDILGKYIAKIVKQQLGK